MKRNTKQKQFSLIGYALFFLTMMVTVTLAVIIYTFVDKKSGGNKNIIAVVMLITIIVLSLICTSVDFLRRKYTVDVPVQKILNATQKISEGDFNIRLYPSHLYKNYTQYDLIMENLNTMALELSKTEVLKTDFISNVSHEIKTPLAVIQSYATALQNENLDSDTRKKYASTLVIASKRLTNLITNILKLSKLENQEIVPDIERIALGESLREIILQYEDFIEDKNIHIDCDIDDMKIMSSPSLLDIVWNNLLSNAIKFTPNGGKISVTLKNENGQQIIKFIDSGCGISPEIGKRIFDKFYQGDTSHESEGNGLGLALVKKVIELLGGEISASSVVGEGSEFTVKLKNKTL